MIVEVEKLNTPNRNGRIYTTSLANKIVEEFEKLPSRSCIGEPADTYRDSMIKFSDASHVVTKMWVEEDRLMAEVEFLSTPTGKVLQSVQESGGVLTFRLAGVGWVEDDGRLNEESYKFHTLIASNNDGNN